MSIGRTAAVTVACVAAATGLRVALDPLVEGVPFITFFPAVVLASVWGGWPAGAMTLVGGAIIANYLWLPPAGTLSLWKSSVIALIAFALFGALIIAVVHVMHRLLAALSRAEARSELLASEMRHRITNLMSLVMSISRLTARSVDTKEEFLAMFEARLLALGRAQHVVADNPAEATDLAGFLERVLEPFDLARIDLDGPPAGVAGEIGSNLALLVHELATNATKYGALSVPDGCVSVKWQRRADGLAMEWTESGGPPVEQPSRSGFGSRLFKATFPEQHGKADISYDPEGVRCSILLPWDDCPPKSAADRR